MSAHAGAPGRTPFVLDVLGNAKSRAHLRIIPDRVRLARYGSRSRT